MKGAWEKGSYPFRGTSRKERVLKALLPGNIRIDARELNDLLAYCARTAQLIRYFNPENEPSGSWLHFLEKDPSVFLALLMDNKPEKWDNEIRDTISKFYSSTETGKKAACRELGEKMMAMVTLMDSWVAGSQLIQISDAISPVNEILKKRIIEEARLEVQQLWQLLFALNDEKIVNINSKTAPFPQSLLTEWNIKTPPDAMDWLEKKPDTNQVIHKLEIAVEKMRRIFQHLYSRMVFFHQKAPAWFKESLEQKHDHAPHIGLLLAFLKLFLHARDQLNTLSAQHLDHYYFDLLRQHMKRAQPDQSIVCFRLADHIDEYLLPANTPLLAGNNENGLSSIYETKSELLLTHTEIVSIRTLFISKNDMLKSESSYKLVSGFYIAPELNMINSMEKGWAVFGEEQLDKSPAERQMIDASIGFVLAAPIFALKEGERKINLHFYFSGESFSTFFRLVEDLSTMKGFNPETVVHELFSNALSIYASGVAGWFPITRYKTNPASNWKEAAYITITLLLSADDPAIVSSVPGTLGDAFETPWPLIKVVLNPDYNIFLYSFVSSLELNTLVVDVEVKGVKSLILMNELGLLDNSKPFQPFGPMPKRHSYLMIGSSELFRKRLSSVHFDIEWNNLPENKGGFATYYRDYPGEINNNSFQVRLSALSNAAFRPVEANQRQSFFLFDADGPDQPLKNWSALKNINLGKLQIKPQYQSVVLPEFNNSVHWGYFKLQLDQPGMAFGHAEYPHLFSRAMVAQTQTRKGFLGLGGNKKEQQVLLPSEPFVPVINKLTVDYTASTTLDLRPMASGENDKPANEKIFVLHAFGKLETFGDGKALDRYLFPQYEDDGYLYLGLRNATAGKPISIFINIKESNQPYVPLPLTLHWQFLSSNKWQHFASEELLSDSTMDFTTTGIVSLLIPAHITSNQTVLPEDLFWIRIGAKGNLGKVGQVTDVQINPVEIVWVDNGDDGHYDPNVKLPMIKELVNQRSEIASLYQPIGFYGSSPADQPDQFYVRTSERLRHKNRGINIWDIEHLVLEHFPFVRRVKCVTWMEYPNLEPGQVKVVAMPLHAVEEAEPRLGFHQLNTIYDFLKKCTSPFIKLEVINPVYEKIKVTCSIRLQKDLEKDQGQYLQRLNKELLFFICPWLNGGNIEMGGSISKNEVLTFLKSRPYIQFLTGFSLVQIFEPDNDTHNLEDTAKDANNGILKSKKPWSILTPTTHHNITFTDAHFQSMAPPTAIEDMRLSTDFIILIGKEEAPLISPEAPTLPPRKEWFFSPK